MGQKDHIKKWQERWRNGNSRNPNPPQQWRREGCHSRLEYRFACHAAQEKKYNSKNNYTLSEGNQYSELKHPLNDGKKCQKFLQHWRWWQESLFMLLPHTDGVDRSRVGAHITEEASWPLRTPKHANPRASTPPRIHQHVAHVDSHHLQPS